MQPIQIEANCEKPIETISKPNRNTKLNKKEIKRDNKSVSNLTESKKRKDKKKQIETNCEKPIKTISKPNKNTKSKKREVKRINKPVSNPTEFEKRKDKENLSNCHGLISKENHSRHEKASKRYVSDEMKKCESCNQIFFEWQLKFHTQSCLVKPLKQNISETNTKVQDNLIISKNEGTLSTANIPEAQVEPQFQPKVLIENESDFLSVANKYCSNKEYLLIKKRLSSVNRHFKENKNKYLYLL